VKKTQQKTKRRLTRGQATVHKYGRPEDSHSTHSDPDSGNRRRKCHQWYQERQL